MTGHTYSTHLVWHGSTRAGYRAYSRAHRAVAPPSPEVALSADPHFRGDADRLNPEQLLVMAASSCQLLSFLAVAAQRGIDVLDYEDGATGMMSKGTQPMRIERIDLFPVVTVAPGTDHDSTRTAIDDAHHGCYIANSLNSSVTISATVVDA